MHPWQHDKHEISAGRWAGAEDYIVIVGPGDQIAWEAGRALTTTCTLSAHRAVVSVRRYEPQVDTEPTTEEASWTLRRFLASPPDEQLLAAFGPTGRAEILAEANRRAGGGAVPVAPAASGSPATLPADSDPKTLSARLARIAFNLAVSGIALLLIFLLVEKRWHDTVLWWRAKVQGVFVSTPAEIVAHGARAFTRTTRNTTYHGVDAWIRFAYTFDGVRHEQSEVIESFGDFQAEGRVQDFERRHPVGTRITVHVDPAEPGTAVFDLEGKIPSGWVNLVGAFFSLFLVVPGSLIAAMFSWEAARLGWATVRNR